MKKLILLLSIAGAAFGQSQSFYTTTTQWAAFGGNASIFNTSSTGYVMVYGDTTVTNPGNEMRGADFNVRRVNSGTKDAASPGWDTFGVDAIITYGAMNLATDSGCPGGFSRCIYGQAKPLVSEMYFNTPISSYYAAIAVGIQSNLEELESGVTIGLHEGMVINPACAVIYTCAGPGGTIQNEVGIDIEDLAATNVTVTNQLGAIQIKGYGNAGKISWTNGASIQVTGSSSGVGELDASTGWQTGSGVGFSVGGSSGNAGLKAGALTIAGALVIDGSDNISTAAYINTGNSFKVSGTSVIDSSRNLVNIAAATFGGTATFNGSLAGTHAQNIGTGDSPTFAGCTGCYTLTNAAITSAVGQNLNTSGTPSWASATVTYLAFNSGNIDTSGDISTTGYIYTSGGYRAGSGNGVSCSGINPVTFTSGGGIVTHC